MKAEGEIGLYLCSALQMPHVTPNENQLNRNYTQMLIWTILCVVTLCKLIVMWYTLLQPLTESNPKIFTI